VKRLVVLGALALLAGCGGGASTDDAEEQLTKEAGGIPSHVACVEQGDDEFLCDYVVADFQEKWEVSCDGPEECVARQVE
jgi:hypothetical protein